jgi:hypothetical protein
MHSDVECLGLKDTHRSTHTHLPKDNEEVNAHIEHLQARLGTATVVDPTLGRDDEAWGHELDHWQSPCGDSASCLTPPKERGRRRDRDDQDLRDIIRSKDARGQIENQRQERERLEQNDVKRGTMTIMVPIMTNLTDSALPKEGVMQEESRHFPTT